MICDSITNRRRVTLCDAFDKAFAFLESVNPGTPDGSYELDGRKVYAMVQSYDTVPGEPAKMEMHRNYIDIQYTISGTEVLAWMSDTLGMLPVETPYDPEKDAEFLMLPPSAAPAKLEMCPGMFAVFFPGDAHWGKVEPACGANHVKKVCVKIAVDQL